MSTFTLFVALALLTGLVGHGEKEPATENNNHRGGGSPATQLCALISRCALMSIEHVPNHIPSLFMLQRRVIALNIKRLKDIGSYRGRRHIMVSTNRMI